MTSLQPAFEEIDKFARNWMQEGNIPGLAIGITDRQQLVWACTYGFASLDPKVVVNRETLFEIGSLGKPFTSIALLQLRDEGKLDLQAPVADYLPWFQVQSNFPPILVHHLMNHTAGIVRGTDLAPHGLYEAWSLKNSRASAPPGEYFSYSNIGYKTLGFLLEHISGQTLQEAIQSRVLDPLGMTQSHAVSNFATRSKTATGYCGFYDDRPEHASHPITPAIWSEYGTGDGCEVSTVEDMAKYLRMLLNRGRGPQGPLISEESFDMMTARGIWTGGDFYGYGLATYPGDGRTYIGHGGGNAGYRSAIVVDLEAGLGVVFLLNRMGETDPVVEAAQYALTVVRASQHHEPLPCLPTVVPSIVSNAPEYAGTYRAAGKELVLRAKDGNLLLEFNGNVVALERRTNDSFYVGHPEFERFLLEFRRDGSGRVAEAFHGSDWYITDHYEGPLEFDNPKEWDAYLGHYRTRNPELSNFRVILRKGSLALANPWGNVEPLVPLDTQTFRIGDDTKSPETLSFDSVLAGAALRALYSGCPYYRTFTP